MALIAYLFIGINSYGLSRKVHTTRFLFPFCGVIIDLIHSILAIAIKDLVMRYNNKELANKKSALWFVLIDQKSKLYISLDDTHLSLNKLIPSAL